MSTERTILHIEDDPNDVLLIERAAKRAKIDVRIESCSNGDAGLAYLLGLGDYADKQLPDLVLLDLKIPTVSGLDVLRTIRSNRDLKALVVVILTSSRHDADISRAYELHANAYLIKPVGFEAVMDMLRAIGAFWLALNQPPVIARASGGAMTHYASA